MSNHSRPLSAAFVLLALAVLGRGCPFESPDEGGPQRSDAPLAPPTGLVEQDPEAPHSLKAGQGGPDEEERCPRRCAQRQTDCAARCGEGPKCRQHCVRSADACHAQCQRTRESREAAREERLGPQHCMDEDGRPRKCTAEEELQLRMAMLQASKMFCRDSNGEYAICPEQLQKLEKSRRYLPKDCRESGCEAVGQE